MAVDGGLLFGPRFNADGWLLTIDSAHAGNGRQIYLVDLYELDEGDW